ncbi:alkaline phosphatase PhoX [Flavobacterium subsaxonicum]|uniref:alkaline phosphatase PhoX n=1 Tax=Flavobacterium subsaxonicum TaxID=426226 RepID=UPI0003FC02FC|nr:alkaline phosphatase PhoX [Flavobacterium subsaxonicum]
MKKSLLSLSLLFSMWSFAVVVSGNVPLFKPMSAPTEAKAPETNKVKKAANKAVLHTTAKVNAAAFTLDPATYPLGKDSQWSYLDNGTSLDAVAWKVASYDNTAWASGAAPLGYGDAQNTLISFGPDSGNKYITSYFTRDINIDLANVAEFVDFGLKRDDGAVVYVNGVEVFRDNMPTGAVTYLTNAASTINDADENRYYVHQVPKTAFTQGVNRIAVEIHNRDGQSSDLKFDMYIQDAFDSSLVVNCDEEHLGCFTSINPTAQTPNLIIPQEHRFQLMFKEGDAYTDGSGTVPGLHDFCAYLPVDGSSKEGRLAVNHENNPGGVSIVNLHLDTAQSLWSLDTSEKVDLYNTALVTTNRNCSGGITHWGTSITAEEATAAGDVNGDGYQDVGWLVEIDPVTAAVKDYGNGQEKLWAMGRMNHENVVVAADNKTCYYGEDGGTHCVYKFVADTAGDLTSGTVYVLKLNLGLSNDEPNSSTAEWIQVPNTTQADRNNLNTVAGTLGGTNFNGVEDCDISPIDGKIYFAAKGRNRVYRFKDNGTTASEFETFVGGMSYPIETATGTVSEPWGDGNDNLTFDDKGNLWMLQDGGLNYIWVVRPDHVQSAPKVLLHSSMPAGAEPTGLTFTPDFKYGFFSVQHPNGSNTPQTDATGAEVSINSSSIVVFSLAKDLGANAPMADFLADDLTVNTNQVVTFTDLSTNTPTSWLWTFEGGTPATSTAAAPTVTYATAGTYNVTLVASNTTGSSEAVTKSDYIVVEQTAGVDGVTGLNNVTLYPNPTKGNITVELNEEAGQKVVVEVYDFLGRKVYNTENQTTGAGQKIELNLANLMGDQVFFIKLNVGDKSGSYKLVKN